MKNQKEIIPLILPKDIVVGDPTAPIRLVMFGDYESEATAKATEVISSLLQELNGRINFVFRHFPLTRLHQKAHKASEAAIGAGQEGKFWEMHQHLMRHRQSLGVISLKSYAREVGVKDKKFLEHLINSDWGWYVQDDLREGIAKGVTAIPALFINGIRFEKEITYKALKSEIDAMPVTASLHSGKQRKRA